MASTNSEESSAQGKIIFKVLGAIFLPVGLILLIIGIVNLIRGSQVEIPSIFDVSMDEIRRAMDEQMQLLSTGGGLLVGGFALLAFGGMLLYTRRIRSYYGGGEFSPSARIKQRTMSEETGTSEDINIIEDSTKKDKSKKLCNYCNALNDEEKLFCSFCGQKL